MHVYNDDDELLSCPEKNHVTMKSRLTNLNQCFNYIVAVGKASDTSRTHSFSIVQDQKVHSRDLMGYTNALFGHEDARK